EKSLKTAFLSFKSARKSFKSAFLSLKMGNKSFEMAFLSFKMGVLWTKAAGMGGGVGGLTGWVCLSYEDRSHELHGSHRYRRTKFGGPESRSAKFFAESREVRSGEPENNHERGKVEIRSRR